MTIKTVDNYPIKTDVKTAVTIAVAYPRRISPLAGEVEELSELREVHHSQHRSERVNIYVLSSLPRRSAHE